MPSFLIRDHQGKGRAYIKALQDIGWTQADSKTKADCLLIDADIGESKIIEDFHDMGKPAFIFPHSARPSLFYDFDEVRTSPHTTANFVATKTHAEIMRMIGYPHPLHVVGFSFCEIKPFRKRRSVNHVAFAPIHPNKNGGLSDTDKKINYDAYNLLLPLAHANKIMLTVRFLYNIKHCGLWFENGINYDDGSPDLSHTLIDRADVVVSHQTFAHLAVARGVPTVMIGEEKTPRYTYASGITRLAKTWDKYKHLLMYPLDLLSGEDPMRIMERANKYNEDVREWRERMIGRPFDPNLFTDCIYQYTKNKASAQHA